MALVTGLRETRGGRVAVDLDGARWRTLPLEVVLRTRLATGEELGRERLRELARELRRARALDLALRALARRDLSAHDLESRLVRRRVPVGARRQTVETLVRTGLVDDGRHALRRATALAVNGHGDAAIRWRLELEGVERAVVDAALADLEPERVRAARMVAAKGVGSRTARELARRGFGDDAVACALEGVAEEG